MSRDMGYTHLELMGVAEHPLDASWGYQVVRLLRGDFPLRFAAGLHVLRRLLSSGRHRRDPRLGAGAFSARCSWPRCNSTGRALYEHADTRLGEHREWGTKVFNYGRHEVRNFLVANALFWADRYHVDGLRVDAVAAMLYLDYSRKAGEWLPNRHGGRENLEAIDFLRQMNNAVHPAFPGLLTIAEESTSFPGVTRPPEHGGLGFNFKWNMGWMNDTLRYMTLDPVHRRYNHQLITFSFVYAWSENFILPISHDEVVHGKRSLLGKMPGDEWQRRANFRLLLSLHVRASRQEAVVHGIGIRATARMARARSAGVAAAGNRRNIGNCAIARAELNHFYLATPPVPRERLRP